MFTNYYKLLDISSDASSEEINTAIERSNLSKSLMEEIKMILQNKSLKALYDAELHNCETFGSKQDYTITNPVLDREIKKVRAYITNKEQTTIEVETAKPKKNSFSWLWILIFLLIGCLGKCMSSYYKGKTLEENRQKFMRDDYNASVNHPALENNSYDQEISVVVDAQKILDDELPFLMEGLGTVDDIDYERGVVIFRMSIQEDDNYGLNVNKINSNKALAKEIVSTQIGMMNEHVKDAMKTIAEEPCELLLIINGSNSNQGTIRLSSDEIMAALSNTTTSKSQDDFSLKMVALTTRLMLPIQVDQVTTWTDTKITDTSYEYVYRIDDENIDLSNIDIGMIKKERLTLLSKNMDIMGKVIRSCIATHRCLVYKYIGKSSNKTIDIVLSDKDLDSI